MACEPGGYFEYSDQAPFVVFRCWGCGDRCPAAPECVVEAGLEAGSSGPSVVGRVVFLCADCRETIGLESVPFYSER